MTAGRSSMLHFNFEIRNYEIDCQGNYNGMNLARGNYGMRLTIQAVRNSLYELLEKLCIFSEF